MTTPKSKIKHVMVSVRYLKQSTLELDRIHFRVNKIQKATY